MSIKSFIKKVLKYDKAVFWLPIDFDDSGVATTDAPDECQCRWVDKQVDFIDKDGNAAISNAEVMVDRDLPFKTVLWHGKLADLADEDASPMSNAGAREIRGKKSYPDLKNKTTIYIVYL